MSDTVIRIDGLGKRYRIGSNGLRFGLRHTLENGIKRLGKRLIGRSVPSPSYEDFWALKDVTLEIKRGECVGIIGRNGAGKSTLLKVLSRITEPTEGEIRIKGRVASLLEVGTGFHMELTGRENIFLNGAILGMRRSEIIRKFDEIVDFAEAGRFLDTPVKYYSSGMYVRLAFGVAAHLEPEILIVDEVLAVGDFEFQKKCLGKMDEVAHQGRTVLFVSHSMPAIDRLCSTSVLLNVGRLESYGPTAEVAGRYLKAYLQSQSEWNCNTAEQNTSDLTFVSAAIRNESGNLCSVFRGDQPIHVELVYRVNNPIGSCQIFSVVLNSNELPVLQTADSDGVGQSTCRRERGLFRTQFVIFAPLLSSGRYKIRFCARYFNIVSGQAIDIAIYDALDSALGFEITMTGALESLDMRKSVTSPVIAWQTSAISPK